MKHTTVTPEAGPVEGTPGWSVTVRLSPGQADLASTFLTRDWASATVTSTVIGHESSNAVRGQFVEIAKGSEVITLSHNESGQPLSVAGWSTSGQSPIVHSSKTTQVCYVGLGDFEFPFATRVSKVTDGTGTMRQRGTDWDWRDGKFRFNRAATSSPDCIDLEP